MSDKLKSLREAFAKKRKVDLKKTVDGGRWDAIINDVPVPADTKVPLKNSQNNTHYSIGQCVSLLVTKDAAGATRLCVQMGMDAVFLLDVIKMQPYLRGDTDSCELLDSNFRDVAPAVQRKKALVPAVSLDQPAALGQDIQQSRAAWAEFIQQLGKRARELDAAASMPDQSDIDIPQQCVPFIDAIKPRVSGIIALERPLPPPSKFASVQGKVFDPARNAWQSLRNQEAGRYDRTNRTIADNIADKGAKKYDASLQTNQQRQTTTTPSNTKIQKNYIIVPSEYSLLHMGNVKEFFEKGKLNTKAENEGNSSVEFMVGGTKFKAIDNTSKVDPKSIHRICGMFVQDNNWQFGCVGNLTPAAIFSKAQGFYLCYEGERVPPRVKQWNVRIIRIHKDDRRRDMAAQKAILDDLVKRQ